MSQCPGIVVYPHVERKNVCIYSPVRSPHNGLHAGDELLDLYGKSFDVARAYDEASAVARRLALPERPPPLLPAGLSARRWRHVTRH